MGNIEKFWVIEDDKGKYWYAFDDKFSKSLDYSTWYSVKRNAVSTLKELLEKGVCEYGSIKKVYTLITY